MLDRSSVEVKRFYRAATAHLEAARVLLAGYPAGARSQLATMAIYLGGYVAECGLKALLLSRTRRAGRAELEGRFRSAVGHNFDWLTGLLRDTGLDLPRQQRTNLTLVRDVWRPELRYDPSAHHRADAEGVVVAAEALLRWAEGG